MGEMECMIKLYQTVNILTWQLIDPLYETVMVNENYHLQQANINLITEIII